MSSRPLSSPPRLIPDDGYQVVMPDSPTVYQEYMLPLVSPLFEATVGAGTPVFDYSIDLFEPYIADSYHDILSSASDRVFGGDSFLGSSAYGLVDLVWPATPPSPPLVGVELNPGPPNGLTKSQAHRLKRKMRKSDYLVALGSDEPIGNHRGPRPNRQRVRPPRQTDPSRAVPASVAAAYATGMTTGKPTIIRTGDDSTRIRHSELLTLVNGTVNFASTSFSMQPGLISIFPWLATQCIGWEKYKFHSLRATFLTRTGTSTAGSVIMAPDYDAADAAPTTEQQATSFHGAADDAPWKTIVINFDMKRSRELFLRSGPLSSNLDIKTYDFANLYVCTADGAAVNWGKIFIEYDVELINPQILTGPYVGGSVAGGGTFSLVNPLGTIPVIQPGSIVTSVTATGSEARVNLTNLVIGQTYDVFTMCDGTTITGLTSSSSGGSYTPIINDLVNGAASRICDFGKFTATSTQGYIAMTLVGATCTNGLCYVAPCAMA